jgi:hypothetical protein
LVEIENSRGQLVTSDESDVTIAIATGAKGAALGGTLTVQAINGVATFSDLSINEEGPFTLRATDAGLRKASSHRFTLTPHLVWAQPPGDVVAGNAMAPAIAIDVEGSTGQLVSNDRSIVKLLISSGPTGAKATGVTARVVNGVATFPNLKFKKTGSYTIEATDGKLAAISSASFNVTAAVATKMLFSVQPIATSVGTDFGVEVELLDRFGNVATTDFSMASLILTGHPTTAVLGGTLTAAVSNGLADFAGLTVDTSGHYQLEANDTDGLRAVKSKSFLIT